MKKIIVILLLILLILGITTVSKVLFQEGNPIPVFTGIGKLSFGGNEIVKISDSPRIYISKTSDGNYPLIELMKNDGWRFEEQLGAGHIFLKDESKLIITSVQYTRRYTIWKFSN